ncbi:hypothetical protein A2U01_0094920, partial [Trifolium medium]|nr:hypothetical protein [Trifolium medium]
MINTWEILTKVNDQGSKLPDLKSREAKLNTRLAALKHELATDDSQL